MRRNGWRLLQAALGALVLWLAYRSVRSYWDDIQAQPIVWTIRWELVVGSLIVTWAMYAALIWGWREVLHGWRQWIKAVDAARIWTISSLGKYIPGKVWAIAGMAMMAERNGVSGAAATGSAIIMQLVSMATGAVAALALTGTSLLERVPGGAYGAIALAIGALFCAIALTSPSLTRRIGFIVRRPDAVQPVEPASLAAAIFANLIAWGGYGLALQLLALGTMPDVQLPWSMATGAFAASYLAGYLMLLLPGGLGVREGVLFVLLKDTIGPGNALALAAVSRLTLTVNELGAAVPFLFLRRPSRDDA